MGLGGVKAKAWCEQKYETRPSPEVCCLQPSDKQIQKTRASFLPLQGPDSLTFNENSQHKKCQASSHESIHIKNMI